MSNPPDWEARQAQLLQDIEQFSKSEIRFDQAPAVVDRPAPEAKPALAQATLTAPTATPAQPPRDTVAAPDAKPAGGLLAQLKRQAEAKQATATQNVALEMARLKQIDEGMRVAYRYLNDLAQQLNVLKPSYPAAYPLGSVLRIENPGWIEGRADYRRQPGSTDNLPFERVSLRYALRGADPIVLEKQDNAIETTRKALIDYGLAFSLEEMRNPKGFVEKGSFTIQPEIKAGLLFTADYSSGEIRLRTLNVQRFGGAEYLVPAETITEQTLDEVALLILGESNQFVQRFKRVT